LNNPLLIIFLIISLMVVPLCYDRISTMNEPEPERIEYPDISRDDPPSYKTTGRGREITYNNEPCEIEEDYIVAMEMGEFDEFK